MKLISMTLALVVALACLVSWTSAMPQPDPVADPGYRRFGGLGYGGYGYRGGYGHGSRGFGYGGHGYGGYRRSYYG